MQRRCRMAICPARSDRALATIPAALPVMFTLSAAFGAQTLARRGVLLTRLSAVDEAASMDVLCADKTGTLTQNELKVVQVVALLRVRSRPRAGVAARASSEADQDPIDAAVRTAAKVTAQPAPERRIRFVPFDPGAKSRRLLSSTETASSAASSRAPSKSSRKSRSCRRTPDLWLTASPAKVIA